MSAKVDQQLLDEKTVGDIRVNSLDSIGYASDDYDYEDPRNYSTNYVDDNNPKGLRVPTKEESESLRRVLGRNAMSSYLICLCELAERASYYSVTGILTNFIQRPLPKTLLMVGVLHRLISLLRVQVPWTKVFKLQLPLHFY